MPKGLKGFQKGHKLFYKNKKGVRLNTGRTHFKKGHGFGRRFKKGQMPWNKGKEHLASEKNPAWKGGVTKAEGYNSFRASKRRIKKLFNGGFHTLGEWETLKAQYNWTCPACGKSEPEIKLTEDHIIPLIKGGSDNIENIQPLCRSCNSSKRVKIIKYEI